MDITEITEENLNKLCPIVLVGSAARKFKSRTAWEVYTPTSLDSLRDIVEKFSTIPYREFPLILDLVKLKNFDFAQVILLKLIEDSSIPIILLYGSDKVSPTILSRTKTFLKYYDEKVSSDLLDLNAGMTLYKDSIKFRTKPEQNIFFRDRSPVTGYFLYNFHRKNTKNLDRFIEIL